jgi:hypothetical protein
MTAPSPSLTDFATLDLEITDALGVLRVARVALARSKNPQSIRAESDAESRLNELLECRHLGQLLRI